MFMNASNITILLKFPERLVVIMDYLAIGTMCLGEYKVKQSMKFDDIIRQKNTTTPKKPIWIRQAAFT